MGNINIDVVCSMDMQQVVHTVGVYTCLLVGVAVTGCNCRRRVQVAARFSEHDVHASCGRTCHWWGDGQTGRDVNRFVSVVIFVQKCLTTWQAATSHCVGSEGSLFLLGMPSFSWPAAQQKRSSELNQSCR